MTDTADHLDPGRYGRMVDLLEKYRDYCTDYRVRLANIRKIHSTSPFNPALCTACLEPWPCASHRAADGVNE